MAVADIAAMQEATEDHTATNVAPDPVDLEERILALCSIHPKGVTEDIITSDQPMITKDKIVKALQRLLSMVSTKK